jgi:hypothetical protein
VEHRRPGVVQIPGLFGNVREHVRLGNGDQVDVFGFEPLVNVRITRIAFGIVAGPAVVVNGIMQRHGGLRGLVARPAHVERDIV